MDPITIGVGIIFLFVVTLIITFFISKLFFKILAIIYTLAIISTVIFAVILIQDAKDLNNQFSIEDKIFLLESENEILAGFKIGNISGQINAEDLEYLEIEEINKDYQKGNLNNILEDNYKVIIIKNLQVNDIDFGQITFSAEEAYEMLKKDKPTVSYAKRILNLEDLSLTMLPIVLEEVKKEFTSEYNFKGKLFAKMFSIISSEKGSAYFINGYKNNQIDIYPETILFKTIKLLPDTITEQFIRGAY